VGGGWENTMNDPLKNNSNRGIFPRTVKLVLLAMILMIGVWVSGSIFGTVLLSKYPPQGHLIDVGGYYLHLFISAVKIV
jgi:hypothetical protein